MTKEWTTLFVEWNTSTTGKHQERYIINDNEETGLFTWKPHTFVNKRGITIGGRVNRSRLLTGAINPLESYITGNINANTYPIL